MSKNSKQIGRMEAVEAFQEVREEMDPRNDWAWFLCGSYRRKMEVVGDLDVVVLLMEDEEVETARERFAVWGRQVNKKAKLSRYVAETRVEVGLATDETFGAMMLFKTGSAEFNVWLRGRAKALGLKLNRYGLWDGEERFGPQSECGIMETIGVGWIEPENRHPRRLRTQEIMEVLG